ncbi:histidinol dehydrogenase [Oscillospiraceae bacterium MB08-C2-2]|nr:histidinol dehydrogenase [Oscillospiraceae bacterium MB08-C2-2]
MIQLMEYPDTQAIEALLRRDEAKAANVDEPVRAILDTVRREGDQALYDYTRQFDGASLSALEVTPEEMDAAWEAANPDFIRILQAARDNIESYHCKQKQEGYIMTRGAGVILGQRVLPLARVGIYVPGGTARYPSTVLMNAIPAKIAGVGETVMVTPPDRDGGLPVDILAAAKVAGVDRIFKIGGAQAIAALSYGTQSVPRVDKIVGPGNLYVATAKRMVYGLVDIDMIAGPSEILVIADETANPRFVAADLLSQAEHDRLASANLITDDPDLAEAVREEIETQLSRLPREEIARSAIENYSAILLVQSIEEAVAISNRIAPEHLEICTAEPFSLLPLVKNAGSVFLGHYVPEALGDYMAGTNHTLPTSGTARFSSPLSVEDFVKKSSFTYYDRKAFGQIGEDVAAFARREGLEAHANSVQVRLSSQS